MKATKKVSVTFSLDLTPDELRWIRNALHIASSKPFKEHHAQIYSDLKDELAKADSEAPTNWLE